MDKFIKQHILQKTAQQSVHLTLGILRQSQAVFYALSFFQLDSVPPPAPAPVTQTVGRLGHSHKIKRNRSNE
jgi:hypothetical protein